MRGIPAKRIKYSLDIPQRPNVIGTLLVCGQGEVGQLGLGDENERKRPTPVQSVKDVVDICAGGMHSMCLTKNGDIYSFGCNDEGALGHPTTEEGSELVPGKIDLPGKSVKISAGDSHSACLLEDGRVFAWGTFRNSHGAMGLTMNGIERLPIEILPGVKCCDIASGADHLILLACDGKVFTMGSGEQGQLGRISLRSAAGDSRQGKNELLKPAPISISKINRCDGIWATTSCTYLRKYDSTEVFAFGLNNYHQLSLKSAKTKGPPELIINPVETNYKDVKKICGGQHHTLLLTNDGKVYAIGRRDYGRLGLGNLQDDVNELKSIEAFEKLKIIDIACGEAQSFAIAENGTVYAWGMGTNLQLGTGNEEDEEQPVAVVSKSLQDKRVIRVDSGGQHSLFLVSDANHNNNYQKSVEPVVNSTTTNEVTENATVTKVKGRKRKAQ
ncbi:regulator of chromosome condensation [Condylostylus longicornis]|uniref:regulator of chromosome condensation n=1 Tax=Condylostylus longicornis TaxID=2530218 RepID=UPI00244E417E|nr:regulator of chromosome condensation [Condylostylus longicornis]